MRLMLALIAAPPLLCAAAPANAAIFEFYEGNNCTQRKLGSVDTALHDKRLMPVWNINLQKNAGVPNVLLPFVVWKFGGWNDEARSVRVSTNWRHVAEHRRAQLTVYDSPHGSKSDDWVRIIIDDVQRVPDRSVCVGSLENNFNRDGVRLERHPKNGIDGKISLIETICDIVCVRNKVGPVRGSLMRPDNVAMLSRPWPIFQVVGK